MKNPGMIAALLVGLTLSACAPAPIETKERTAQEPAPVPLSVNVVSVHVDVPGTLKVSEANRYYPSGDIVWRGDPPGDRYAQVEKIVETAARQSVQGLDHGEVPVVLDIRVTRFHALTEKARYTVGGVHALQFWMRLSDPETGETLGDPRFVKADFRALGGSAALRADREGRTQKVRIINHLTHVIRTELTDPEGYHAGGLGLVGAINQL